MRNSSLHCLTLLLLLLAAAASPLAGAFPSSYMSCNVNQILLAGNDTDASRYRYTANSTYEANLRRLAAVITAAASPGQFVGRAVGFWPNRAWATARCESGDCAACIAGAFKRVEARCPFGKDGYFYSRNCSLSFGAEWRGRKKRTATLSNPMLAGDA